MKKYRVKIKSPFLEKGEVCEVDNDGKFAIENELCFDPKLYPEIFEEIEQPLFTTEDGKDIYIGEKVWFVENGAEHAFSTKAKKDEVYYDTLDTLDGCKSFSTKELAEKYIDENKLRFSRLDMEKAFDAGIEFMRLNNRKGLRVNFKEWMVKYKKKNKASAVHKI